MAEGVTAGSIGVVPAGIDSGQVARLPPECHTVLPLSPVVSCQISRERFHVLSPYEVYTTAFHARVLVGTRRLRRWLDSELPAVALSDAGRTNLQTALLARAATALRILHLLKRTRAPEWLVPDGPDWKTLSRPDAAALHLLRFIDTIPIHFASEKLDGAPEGASFKARREWESRLQRHPLRDRNVIVISTVAQGFMRIADAFLDASRDHILVESPVSLLKDRHAVSLIEKRDLPESRRVPLDCHGDPQIAQKASREVEALCDRVPDPYLREAFRLHRASIASGIGRGESLLPELERTLRKIRPRAVLLYDIAEYERVWLAEAAIRAGIPRWQFAHMVIADCAHTPARWEAYHRRATQLGASSQASVCFAQSPNALRFIERIAPNVEIRRTRPVIWAPVDSLPRRDPTNPVRTVLHTGNFDAWSGYTPMMNETAEDYLEGILQLARAVSVIPSTRLLIRMKPNFKWKAEVDAPTIRYFLAGIPNVEIRQENSFYADLAEADVVVSYASTVVEEAVYYGTPTLLWGGHMHLQVLPASNEPPSMGRTTGVYACTSAEDLPPMLSAILDCHAGRALTAEERGPYVWDDAVPGRADIVRSVCRTET